jgi:hypothetical protein
MKGFFEGGERKFNISVRRVSKWNLERGKSKVKHRALII